MPLSIRHQVYRASSTSKTTETFIFIHCRCCRFSSTFIYLLLLSAVHDRPKKNVFFLFSSLIFVHWYYSPSAVRCSRVSSREPQTLHTHTHFVRLKNVIYVTRSFVRSFGKPICIQHLKMLSLDDAMCHKILNYAPYRNRIMQGIVIKVCKLGYHLLDAGRNQQRRNFLKVKMRKFATRLYRKFVEFFIIDFVILNHSR